jgi:hypothetical protein
MSSKRDEGKKIVEQVSNLQQIAALSRLPLGEH